jgi:hypothetical protein
VLTLYDDARVPVPTTDARNGRRDPGWTDWRAPVMSTEEAPELRALWRTAFERRAHETEDAIRVYRGDVKRCDRLIRDWRPGELREVPRVERDPSAPRRRRRFFGRRA